MTSIQLINEELKKQAELLEVYRNKKKYAQDNINRISQIMFHLQSDMDLLKSKKENN